MVRCACGAAKECCDLVMRLRTHRGRGPRVYSIVVGLDQKMSSNLWMVLIGQRHTV